MKKILYLFGMPLLFLTVFSVGFAQEVNTAAQTSLGYEALAPVPGLNPGSGDQALGEYINSLYTLSIGIGAVLAVLMIVIGGLQYMGTDVFSKKGEGRTRITNAGLGLGLLLASFLILQTINTNLTSLEVDIEQAESSATLTELIIASGGTFEEDQFCIDETRTRGARIGLVSRTEQCFTTESECNEARPATSSGVAYNCRSYKKTVEFNPCEDCVNLSEVNVRLGNNPCQKGGGEVQCSFNRDLLELVEATERPPLNTGVIITEAWPPTVNHQAPCHRDGTCIDFDLDNPTPANIARTIQTWEQLNGQAIYEVKTQDEKDDILAALNTRDRERIKNNICVFTRISGSHFSGYTRPTQDTTKSACRKG